MCTYFIESSKIPGSLDYNIRARSQKDIRWIKKNSPADNHDFCQDE